MLNRHSPGNVSLLISDLSEKDQGHYTCVVDERYQTHISLLVKGKLLAMFYGLISQDPYVFDVWGPLGLGSVQFVCF